MNEYQKKLANDLIGKHAHMLANRIRKDADQSGGTGSYVPGDGILRDAMAQMFRETMNSREVLTRELKSRVVDAGEEAREKGLVSREYYYTEGLPILYGCQVDGPGEEHDGMMTAHQHAMFKAIDNGGPEW